MVYCEQDMCESKLGRLMQAFRTDRPSEWQMDEFIGMAEDMHKMNKELLAALKRVVGDVRTLADHSYGVHGLHQNGDLAPWNSLFSGGFFESWLLSVDDADAVIAKTEGGAA